MFQRQGKGDKKNDEIGQNVRHHTHTRLSIVSDARANVDGHDLPSVHVVPATNGRN